MPVIKEKIRRGRRKISFRLTKKELCVGVCSGVGYVFVVALLFYNNLLAAIFLTPYLYVHLRELEKVLYAKKMQAVGTQFKDGMLAISASLAVGYSVENSFREALAELTNLYGADAVLVGEFREIVRKINLNENVEDALEAMAEKIELEEALYFAEVFRFAKRSGGNLMEIIRSTARNISDKIEVKEEIAVVISGKKMEQKVMNLMPFGIIAYLRFGAYEFVAPLYGNVFGAAVMTVCLLVYFVARMLSDRITDIAV